MYVLQSIGVGPDGDVRYYWIPNVGDAYVIGSDGTLWSRYKGWGNRCYLSDDWRQCKAAPNPKGYLQFILCFNGTRRVGIIHVLVCEAVYGPCPPGLEVCHNDGNPLNNHDWNLRYDTHKNNTSDKVKHGTYRNGEDITSAKLTWTKVREIRAKYASGNYLQASLEREYGMSNGMVSRIVNNLIWVETP